jgi:hypothetical protein
MGIRVFCPNGHRLNLKSHLAGKQGICPHCGTTVTIPTLEKAEELGMLKNPRMTGREQALGGSVYRTNGSNGSAVGLAEAPVAKGSADAPCEPNLASPYARTNDSTPHSTGTNGAAANGSAANGSSSAIHGEDASALDDGGIDITAPVNGSHSSSSSTIVTTAAAAPVEDEVDPIAENPQAVWYVRTPQGGQYGPAAGDIMRKWIAEGRVQADFWVWREGWGDWQKASASIPSLKKPAPTAAPAPLAAPVAPSATPSAPVARTNAPAPANGYAPGEVSPTQRQPARRRKGGIHPLAILAVVGLGLVCFALLAVLVAMLAGAL